MQADSPTIAGFANTAVGTDTCNQSA